MDSYTAGAIENQYADYQTLLQLIFPPHYTGLNRNFDPNGEWGPFIIMPLPNEIQDITAEPHKQNIIAAAHKMIRKRIRLEEYILGRPLTEDESALIRNHKAEFMARMRDPFAMHEGAYEAAFTLPLKLYDPQLLHRWDEFVIGQEAAASPPEGIKYAVSTDEAAVALSAWTGVPWRIVLMEQSGFQQLRLETENIENTQAVANMMQPALEQPTQDPLGKPKKLVFQLGKKLYIPVSFLQPEQIESMRADGLNTAISALANSQVLIGTR